MKLFLKCSLFVLKTVKEPFKNICSYCKLWNCFILDLSLFKKILGLFKVNLNKFFQDVLEPFKNICSETQQRNSLRTVQKLSIMFLKLFKYHLNICSFCKFWNCSIFVLSLFKKTLDFLRFLNSS